MVNLLIMVPTTSLILQVNPDPWKKPARTLRALEGNPTEEAYSTLKGNPTMQPFVPLQDPPEPSRRVRSGPRLPLRERWAPRR